MDQTAINEWLITKCRGEQGVYFKKNTITLAIGSALLLGNSAWAAEQGAALELDSVMVTGEKINRTLEQTQSSVVVETAEDLRTHGDKNLVDVFARTPGVFTQAGNENWGIRGVPVVEAMTACVLADAFLRHRGQTGGGAFTPGVEGRRL